MFYFLVIYNCRDKIERFIDDNKALMRRMYGDFEMNMSDGGPRQQTKKRKRRFIDEPDIFLPPGVYPTFEPDDNAEPHAEEQGESYFGKLRNKRQSANQGNRNAKQTQNTPGNGSSSTGRYSVVKFVVIENFNYFFHLITD